MKTRLALLVCCALGLGADAKSNLAIEKIIDREIDAQLKENKLKPAAAVNDAGFLRRLTLDLLGRIPTLEEQQQYLSSKDANKKAQLIDRLMASPEYVRHQAIEFNTLLQAVDNTRKGIKKGPLYDYLAASFKDKKGWDAIFLDLMLPDETDAKSAGAGEFLKSRVKDLNRLTIDVSVVFLGVNVSCAQCHDHPHVNAWTQDHFYGMKSFFARTVDAGGFVGEKDFGMVKYIPNKGQEKVAPVMFLTGKSIAAQGMKEPSGEEKKKEQERLEEAKKTKKAPKAPSYSLRAQFVATALEPGQRGFFTRSIANRVWNRFLGRGLVMPLDQMHVENPASHPKLLDFLANDLADNGYQIDRLVRGIVSSNVYARSSRWDSADVPADNLYAVAKVRPLTPSQLGLSLKVASIDPAVVAKSMGQLVGTSERLANMFVQPGENFQVGVAEAMLFANNESVLKELLEGNDTLPAVLDKTADAAKKIDLAMRTVLARPAEAAETKILSEYLNARTDRSLAACQQMVWALMTSAEFRFNH